MLVPYDVNDPECPSACDVGCTGLKTNPDTGLPFENKCENTYVMEDSDYASFYGGLNEGNSFTSPQCCKICM